jgi:carboxyl-terminal processing protease
VEDINPVPIDAKPCKRRWTIIKILGVFFILALVYGTGVAVGRGDLQLGSHFSSQNTSLPNELDFSSVNQVYNLLKADYDGNLDVNKLLDGLKSGLSNATGDPYTEYFSPKDAKAFNEELTGSFTGIGAELGTDSNSNVVIVSPLSGYPAEKAGLKPKDIVAAVDGQSTSGMSIYTVVQKIRGPKDTKVTLTIVRGAKHFDVTITRAQITVASVKYHEDGAIGYIKISQFSDDTVKLATQAAQEFKAKGVKAVVLDLRNDPGGYLDGAVSISSLWLNQGQTVVQEKRGSTIMSTEYAEGNNLLKGLPTIVLINGGSASASEITAGALHDNNAATLLGEKSFGKGSVQQVDNLLNGAELKVTIARWYTPSGKNIDKQGITPDTSIVLSDADFKAGLDPQKDKAYAILHQKVGP